MSRNQRAIVCEGPDNLDAGLAGACTFQDKHIEQYHVLGKLKTIVLFGLRAAALLPKHRIKDRDTLIQQSFLRIYQLRNKNDKKLKI